MRSNVLAIDPGKTIGWAMLERDENGTSYTCGELDFMSFCDQLVVWTHIFTDELDLVSEEFKITIHTAKNTQQTWSLEVMGVARYMSLKMCAQDLIISQRPPAMNFSTDDRLKAMGWYVPGLPHARAASRHLMHYLVKNGWWDDRIGLRETEETPVGR